LLFGSFWLIFLTMCREFSASELAAKIGGELNGDGTVKISRVNSLESATTGEIAFVEDAKLFCAAAKSGASALIAPLGAEIEFAGALIRAENPKLSFAKAAAILHSPRKRQNGWHETAIVAESATVAADFIGAFVRIGENSDLGENAQIFDGVKIGNNVSIGKRTIIYPNCVVYDNVSIGDDCTIHAGAIIGADGFGFVRGQNGYVKFPQIGTVIIENEVEIGANSCIDRAALGETRIGRGTKIDNLVQIAHNVQIGERVVIAAQTGISGSTVIESDAVIGGQVGMGDHARVLSGAIIGSKAGILPGKIVRAGVWWGVPVQPLDEYKRQNAHVKALPRLREELKNLREKLEVVSKAVFNAETQRNKEEKD
jgi:UDP-3-O-[3-hydroxymyristoyl] glucosamine N-acyltransferase